MTYFAGIDPDLHNASWAVVDDAGQVRYVGVLKVPDNLKRWEAVNYAASKGSNQIHTWAPNGVFVVHSLAVEQQYVASLSQGASRSKTRPDDLVRLGVSAGVVASLFTQRFPVSDVRWVPPLTLDKAVRQSRLLRRLEWAPKEFILKPGDPLPKPIKNYQVPRHLRDQLKTATASKHVLDAIEIALGARDCWAKAKRLGL